MLAPAVSDLLRQSKVETSDLSAVAVTIGPGSFTGLRVGVAMAKAMAYALRIPTIGVDTLEVLAVDFERSLHQAGASRRVEFWTVLDAYRGEFFVAKWLSAPAATDDSTATSTGVPNSHSPNIPNSHLFRSPLSLVPSQILPQRSWYELAANDSSETLVVGSGATKLLANGASHPGSFIALSRFAPTAASVIALANRMLSDGKVTSPMDLLPVYLRGSAAEEKKLATKTAQ